MASRTVSSFTVAIVVLASAAHAEARSSAFLGYEDQSETDIDSWDTKEMNTPSYKSFLEATSKAAHSSAEEDRRSEVEEQVHADSSFDVDLSRDFIQFEEDDVAEKQRLTAKEVKRSKAMYEDYKRRTAALS